MFIILNPISDKEGEEVKWLVDESLVPKVFNLCKTIEFERDYCGKKLTTYPLVPGRLAKVERDETFYKDVLKADWDVVSVVRDSYVVPFLQEPPKAQNTKIKKHSHL